MRQIQIHTFLLSENQEMNHELYLPRSSTHSGEVGWFKCESINKLVTRPMKTCNEWMAPDLARSWKLETAAQLSGDPISIPGPRLLARSWQLETVLYYTVL